jgi:hypothetical protein
VEAAISLLDNQADVSIGREIRIAVEIVHNVYRKLLSVMVRNRAASEGLISSCEMRLTAVAHLLAFV